MKRLFGASVLASTTLLLTPMHATASEIRVVRGSFSVFINTFGNMNLQGTDGLKLEVDQIPDFDSAGPWYECEIGCLGAVDLGSRVMLPLFQGGTGQVTIHGQTYPFIPFLPSGGGGPSARVDLAFETGSIVLPEFTTDRLVILRVPFTLSGSVQIPNRQEPDTFEVFEVHGSGVATVYLIWAYWGQDGWSVRSVTYDVEPRGDVSEH